jgi:hypothetical protein
MEDLNYAHLHCDLLNKVALTIITLKGVKSPHKNIHEQYLQNCMFVCVKNFGIESTFPKGDLKKVTCMLLQLSQQPICHQSLLFNLNWFPCFFTWILLKNSNILFKVGTLLPLLSSLLM